MAELIERLAHVHGCEVHLYAQRVEDIALEQDASSGSTPSRSITWHKVPSIPGPHLLQFAAWLFFNGFARWWGRVFGSLRFDAVFSPGINCFNANAILVHAVFHRLVELQKNATDAGGWRGLHRRMYYGLVCTLENRVYKNKRIALAGVSRHTAEQMRRYFGRDDVAVVPNGVDMRVFNSSARLERRAVARNKWGFTHNEKVALLIGNDWRTKGLHVLLEAAGSCCDLPLRVLVVGQENVDSWKSEIETRGLTGRVSFSKPALNVIDFLAAADVCVAPSREDSFNLPTLEAMACGLPVVVSREAGVSEWITDGQDGFLLRDARNAIELAEALRKVITDDAAAQRIGENAVCTAAALSWERHADSVYDLLSNSATKR